MASHTEHDINFFCQNDITTSWSQQWYTANGLESTGVWVSADSNRPIVLLQMFPKIRKTRQLVGIWYDFNKYWRNGCNVISSQDMNLKLVHWRILLGHAISKPLSERFYIRWTCKYIHVLQWSGVFSIDIIAILLPTLLNKGFNTSVPNSPQAFNK